MRIPNIETGRVSLGLTQGLTPEEITTEIPHLSLAQVYAALTYYHANRDAIEADMAAEEAESQHLEKQRDSRRDAT